MAMTNLSCFKLTNKVRKIASERIRKDRRDKSVWDSAKQFYLGEGRNTVL